MLLTVLIFTLLIVINAIADGFRDRYRSKPRLIYSYLSHGFELVLILITIFVITNPKLFIRPISVHQPLWWFGFYIVGNFGMFDAITNLVANRPLVYIGNTGIIDRTTNWILTKIRMSIGYWFWLKFVAATAYLITAYRLIVFNV